MDATVNRPEVVAEITALFERYERALVEKDVAVLDDDPGLRVVRINRLGRGLLQDQIRARERVIGAVAVARVRSPAVMVRLPRSEGFGARGGRT